MPTKKTKTGLRAMGRHDAATAITGTSAAARSKHYSNEHRDELRVSDDVQPYLINREPAKAEIQQHGNGKRMPRVAIKREYAVLNVTQARQISTIWLSHMNLENALKLGLPEIDDRQHFWRVPLMGRNTGERVGEAVIDAKTSLVVENKSTSREVLEARLLGRPNGKAKHGARNGSDQYVLSSLGNTVILGDSETEMQSLPAESVDLVFTSPPYYNARPEYSDFVTYEDYLLKIRKVIQSTRRVLAEGRFFVMNTAPVLIRRTSRNEASKRIAVPFDLHRIFVEEGFDFIDDIIWVKPEGAGWATGRGRRFAADRNPLQYKAVPVTEYVLVYRKHSDKLIDWNIRNHPRQDLVTESKIPDNYEHTNVWRIHPATHSKHPAVFPIELAEKVIRYYSFVGDVVLDPFAGIGTVGKAAVKLSRKFVLIDENPDYISEIRNSCAEWLGRESENVLFVNCEGIRNSHRLL
jgi:DNA modification methylase